MLTIKSFLLTLNAMILFINKMLFKSLFLPCTPTPQLIGNFKSVQKELFSSLTSTIHQETAVNSVVIFNHAAKFQVQERFFKRDGKLILQLIFRSHLEMKQATHFMLIFSELTYQPKNQPDIWL